MPSRFCARVAVPIGKRPTSATSQIKALRAYGCDYSATADLCSENGKHVFSPFFRKENLGLSIDIRINRWAPLGPGKGMSNRKNPEEGRRLILDAILTATNMTAIYYRLDSAPRGCFHFFRTASIASQFKSMRDILSGFPKNRQTGENTRRVLSLFSRVVHDVTVGT